jgi:hypothetical protein
VTTQLAGDLKRELTIGGHAYTVTLSPTSLTLAMKGRRKGLELKWVDLVSGEAALATALNASLTANIVPKAANPPAKRKAKR